MSTYEDIKISTQIAKKLFDQIILIEDVNEELNPGELRELNSLKAKSVRLFMDLFQLKSRVEIKLKVSKAKPKAKIQDATKKAASATATK